MRLTAATNTLVPAINSVKMEDRKRPALDDINPSAPPHKRQAVSVNGNSAHPDNDMPWKDDIESFQKDAILRQMREYKREKTNLESQLASMTKRSTYHDDHLRIIDAWFLQLLDEIALLSNANPSVQPSDGLPYDSALISAEQEKFKEHLNKRSTEIKSATSAIFAQLPSPTPDARQLQERLTNLLAAQKVHETELHRLSAEKDQLSERLEDACYRYMIAEKKLDRTKSAQVAKLEAQGIAGSRTETSSGQGESSTVSDGVIQHNSNSGAGESGSVDDAKQKEAVAAAGRRAEQVERLAAENKKLTEELTASQVRLAGLTDEDYASSDLFRLLKTQHEEVIKRANNLEAINTLLRAEAKQLQAERSSYREEAERELSSASIELESQLARTEADLARIRHTRDELMTDVNMRKTTHDTSQASSMQVKELANAQELRISALESEVDRFRQQEDAADHVAQGDPAAEALSPSVLHNRLGSLEKEKIMLETELKSMEAAYRKASAAASKRVAETAETEEKITRLVAEKAKADQKYFGAMKAKEARESEFKALKTQSMKSSEIVMQLKEAESSCSSLLVNLEKQLADARDSLSGLTLQYRTAQSTVAEQKISNDRQAVNITELKKLLADKDTAAEAAAKAQRDAEVEASELKVRVQEFQKSLETWRKKGIGNQSEEYEMLRTIAICTVCRKNFKNTAIKTCGHVFCQECVDERLQSRSRKCPNCGRAFGVNDHLRVTL